MDIEQLLCPICMCVYSYPVTACCGHTFCRQCLSNSTRTKLICPMCRAQIPSKPERMEPDHQIAKISEKFKLHKKRVEREKRYQQQSTENKDNPSVLKNKINDQQLPLMPKMIQMLLLDVRSDDLLLPYHKGSITFQLQSPLLKGKLQNFIARPQHPFQKFGLVASVQALEYLRHNVYSCTIKIKSFCKIEQEWVESGEQAGQQYYYRCCDACQIAEDMSIFSIKEKTLKEAYQNQRLQWAQDSEPMQQINQKFLHIFKQITNKNILKAVSHKIDKKILLQSNDYLAVYYTIIGLLDIPNTDKYAVVTSFDTEKRIQQIQKFLSQFVQKAETNNTSHIKIIGKPENMLNVKENIKFVHIQALIILVVLALWFWLSDNGPKIDGEAL